MDSRRITVTSGDEGTRAVLALLDDACAVVDLRRPQSYWLRLATDEIMTNIAHHGYRGAAGDIDVTVGGDETKVWIRLEDDAPPFDPEAYDPAPRLSVDPRAREQEGGYGLLLVVTKLDEFHYDHGGGRNCNLLVMHRPADPQPPPEGGDRRDEISADRR